MRNIWFLAAFLVLALFLLFSSVMAQPKMYLAEEKFDFGYVPQSSKIGHVFWIKSVGDDTLKIINIKTG